MSIKAGDCFTYTDLNKELEKFIASTNGTVIHIEIAEKIEKTIKENGS